MQKKLYMGNKNMQALEGKTCTFIICFVIDRGRL